MLHGKMKEGKLRDKEFGSKVTSMASSRHAPFLLLLLLMMLFLAVRIQGNGTKKLYIVYMGERQHEDPEFITAMHHDLLISVLGSKETAMDSIVYSYRHGFSGFAAMLTEIHSKKIAKLPGVIGVKPSRKYQLHTTRSWDFIGLNREHRRELLQQSNWGSDAIIGIIDTGIWPESRSFDDRGYGPIPSRWKGRCITGQEFDGSCCSRKIIGARWYTGGVEEEYIKEDYLSARDRNGHGTHTASTAAGSFVDNVSFYGLAGGEARGGAPRARLAIYKALWGVGGHGSDAAVLAAVDDAIHDGVDVLSLSLGPGSSFEGDSSFVTLEAVMKGITVVYSAGNRGPQPQSVANLAPWAITVAATSIDRAFPTAITLGNNQTLVGQALYYRKDKDDEFNEIIFGSKCDDESLNGTDVYGKVVLCHSGTSPPKSLFLTAAINMVMAGAKGLIFAQYTTNYLEEPEQVCKLAPCRELIPLVLVDVDIGTQIGTYIRSVSNAVVKVKPTITEIGSEVYAPKVAAFSSRGPNVLLPGVLKPDIAAPGVTILAANKDHYIFKSGTSMAVPHVSGIVALLKSLHPDWSPAIIKSALVTTASVTDGYNMPIKAEGVPRKIADPFDYGGGQVDPNRAADPGLVYDIDPREYKDYFHCSYGEDVICQSTQKSAYHLNFPSITIPNLKASVTVKRTVKNVGEIHEVYRATLHPPPGIKIDVKPTTLEFDAGSTIQSFEVTISSILRVQGDYTFGSLTWSSDRHIVRIPICVKTVVHDFYADVA